MKHNELFLEEKRRPASASGAIAALDFNDSPVVFVPSADDIAGGVDQLRWARAFSDPNDSEVVWSV
jgi:hypothetical protein